MKIFYFLCYDLYTSVYMNYNCKTTYFNPRIDAVTTNRAVAVIFIKYLKYVIFNLIYTRIHTPSHSYIFVIVLLLLNWRLHRVCKNLKIFKLIQY